jgi:hypothetical protein
MPLEALSGTMPVRALPLALAALAVASSLTGCSAIAAINNVPTQGDYPTWADSQGPHSGTSATGAVETTGLPKPPAFVPHDATGIYVRTLKSGQSILTYSAVGAPDPSLCHAGALSGKPKLLANWWPITKLPTEGTVCSPGWQVFSISGVTYAWHD